MKYSLITYIPNILNIQIFFPQNMIVGEIFFNQEELPKFEVRRDKICVVHRRKAVCVMDLSTFAAPCVQSSISCLQSDRTSTSLRVIILTNNIKTLNASPILHFDQESWKLIFFSFKQFSLLSTVLGYMTINT